ncbi:MAG: tRNA uridine-5-carboxymethylaminomethyl(34) synthesis GTPase MnmE, partial [Muribaculaceae bacterium]|nr:tRNA uridine-5-carboxymethylaminomethyl(34) synthesis GTPase MnmE [Muribaculaceae bacterium]
WIQRELIALLIDAGCRLANPGEFTRRAFLAGKMDLAEAEGVADLIASSSRASHSLAINQMRGTISKKLEQLRNELIDLASLLELELDFSEEEVEFASRERLIQLASDIHDELCRLGSSFRRGNAIKEGIPVAIVGQTNAGKSSLLNAILGDDRAIVSDIHGTTRDTVEETIELGDHIFRFIDTAGLRHTDDEIEKIGIERSIQAMKRARLVIVVIDATRPADRELLDLACQTDAEIIIALNKSDINPSSEIENTNFPLVRISAKTGQGISSLLEAIEHTQAAAAVTNADVILTNARHAESIARATDDIRATVNGLTDGIPVDLVAQDLRSALHHLSAITGAISTPEILATVFSRFSVAYTHL